MVTNVSSLLKTIHSVEDEASRGVRAITSTIEAVKEAINVSNFQNKYSKIPPKIYLYFFNIDVGEHDHF